MRLISYRGNKQGPNPELENTMGYVQETINRGLDVMVDLWLIDNKIYMGPEESKEPIDFDWLERFSSRLWLNCRDHELLSRFLDLDPIGKYLHYFYLGSAETTLTSRNYLLATEDFKTKNCIVFLPDINNNITDVYGICTNDINNFK